jgi:hypothetical protein
MDPTLLPPPPGLPSRAPRHLAIIAICLFGVQLGIIGVGAHQKESMTGVYIALMSVVGLAQFVLAVLAIVVSATQPPGMKSVGAIVAGAVTIAMGGLVWVIGAIWIALTAVSTYFGGGGGGGGFGFGGAWGRPLRIRGRQLHPSLTEGADWTAGPQPDASKLDEATRRALEALWLHDAQKEHASVPAFARVSWMLAAAGAPAELLVWAHRAGIEEIEHAQACFALAAGYGGRSFTVEPMPELLLGGLDGKRDPRITLAIESLSDGCQLEDFNADVAAACAEVCTEPVTRRVLETIAREERSHAELSWAIVEWLVVHHREVVADALAGAVRDLDHYPRPTAVAHDKLELVGRADALVMRSHGRLPDARWAACWDARLVETRRRLAALLAPQVRAAA